jgi:hypothetical protein
VAAKIKFEKNKLAPLSYPEKDISPAIFLPFQNEKLKIACGLG